MILKRRVVLGIQLIALVVFLGNGCAGSSRRVSHLPPPASSQVSDSAESDAARAAMEEGIASWYGPGFHGRRTANGERFNQKELTCAHKTLPFGTRLKITNLANGQELTARVNDRGPFIEPRIVDVSKEVAKRLGFLREGTTWVRLEEIPEENPINGIIARNLEE